MNPIRERINWDENFRPDGKRMACPECGNTFDTLPNERLRPAIIRHYQMNHPDSILKSVLYMNMIEEEVSKELNKK